MSVETAPGTPNGKATAAPSTPGTRTLSGTMLDALWLGTVVCLLTLFAYLVWAVIEVQDHYYFVTQPFSTISQRIP